MSYKEPNRPPMVGLTNGYHGTEEALERAEFEASVGRYNKKPKPTSLMGRLKGLFVRPAR